MSYLRSLIMKKNDILLIGILLLIVAIWWGGSWWAGRGVVASQVLIWQDTVLVGTYQLNGNQNVILPIDSNYGHNKMIIENGSVRMLEADCPDQVCVHTAPISKPGQTIVCLPNRVVIEITGSGEVLIDDISQ